MMKPSDLDPKWLIAISLLSGGSLGTVGQYFGFTAPAQQTKSDTQMAAELIRDELRWCMGALRERYEVGDAEGEEAWLITEMPARRQSELCPLSGWGVRSLAVRDRH